MRLILKIIPSILFLLSLQSSIFAATLHYDPGTTQARAWLKCQAGIDKIGAINLKQGKMSVDGNVIVIYSSLYEDNAPEPVLTGSVIKVEADLESIAPQITGLAYFTNGIYFPDINDSESYDLLFTKQGNLTCKINKITATQLQVIDKNGQNQTINISDLLFVRSPLVYVFRIPIETKYQPQQRKKQISTFDAEVSTAVFKSTNLARSLPLSSILHKDNENDTANKTGLDKYGHDVDMSAEEEDDGPIFNWQQAGMHLFPKNNLP